MKTGFTTSWKTTLGGALAGLGLAVSSIYPEQYRLGLLIAAVGTAINGVFGRDNNVSSEQAKGDNEPKP